MGAIGVAIATAVAGAAVTNLMAPKPKTPAIKGPTLMPVQDTTDSVRRLSILEQQKRQGRASTILTDKSDTLG